MSIKSIIINYALTLIVFLIIDMAWLGFIAKNLYQKYLGNFLSDKVNWTATFIFYFIFIIGVSFFAIYPSVNKNSPQSSLILGSLFGLFTYSTYDLTNLATLKAWPLQIVFIDIAWGVILSAIVSLIGFYIVKFVK